MPRKRRYDFKRKKSYRTRFNDKKINTKIEKKIQAIAQREDQKNMQFYVNKHLTLEDPTNTGVWPSNSPRPTITGLKKMEPQTVYYTCLSDLGGYANLNITPQYPLNTSQDIRTAKNMEFIVKTISAHLQFANMSTSTTRVKASIIYIPNLNSATDDQDDRLVPNIHMLGDVNRKYVGIFRPYLKANATYVNSVKDFTVVATKTITLPPQRPIIKYQTTVDPNNILHIAPVEYEPFGGESLNTFNFKQLNISKTYKKGKKLYWNPASTGPIATIPFMCSNGNFWLVYASDQESDYNIPYNADASGASVGVMGYGISGCKFRFGRSMSYINKT